MARGSRPGFGLRTACQSCRKGKRRCDGGRPRCGLCARKDIDCNYPSQSPSPPLSSRPRSRQQLPAPSLSPALPSASTPSLSPSQRDRSTRSRSARIQEIIGDPFDDGIDVSTIFYLAPDVFSVAQLELPGVQASIPPALAEQVRDASALRTTATVFFHSIHSWLPIVSKEAFLTRAFNPLSRDRAALTLLASCMKLVCKPLSLNKGYEKEWETLYRSIKQLFSDFLSSGAFSICVLQAGILITIYEMNQAIYPSVYHTIALCAQYAHAIGINRLTLETEYKCDKCQSWTEVEERRRTWWAVIMLDRVISINNPSRRTVTDEPSFEAYLPVDDRAWEDGTSGPEDAISISKGFSLKTGLFSRLVQATYLLGQALKAIRKHIIGQDDTTYKEEAAQLRRTLLALINLSDSESRIRGLEFCPQIAVCISTIFLLQEYSWKIENQIEEPKKYSELMSFECRLVLDRLSNMAPSFRLNCLDSDAAQIPLFITQLLYQSLCLDIKIMPYEFNDKDQMRREIIKDVLEYFRPVWRLAGLYLTILKSKEAISLSKRYLTSEIKDL